MSNRFGSLATQYLDSNGNPLALGLIYFYEPSTLTPKDTYTDSGEGTPNTNPVVLDGEGRQGDIWFTGTAKAVLKTSADVTVDTTDPVGSATADDAFAVWDTTTTYAANDNVKGSDGNYYTSISGSNQGNDPTSSPAAWMEIQFINVYNASYTYAIGDVALSANLLWVSIAGSNINNTPAAAPIKRQIMGRTVLDTAVTPALFTAVTGERYLIDTSVAGFTMTLPLSPNEGDIVEFVDYGQSFLSNNFTIDRNSEDIMNLPENLVCDLNYYSGALQYSGTTKGWVLV